MHLVLECSLGVLQSKAACALALSRLPRQLARRRPHLLARPRVHRPQHCSNIGGQQTCITHQPLHHVGSPG